MNYEKCIKKDVCLQKKRRSDMGGSYNIKLCIYMCIYICVCKLSSYSSEGK